MSLVKSDSEENPKLSIRSKERSIRFRWVNESGNALRAIIVITLICGLTMRPTRSAADDSVAQAKQLFDKAEVHFSLGEFEQALKDYEEAYRVKPLPGFLFNIGQCHRKLNNCEKANFYYRQYLVRLPAAANRKDVESLIALCDAELGRAAEAAAAQAAADQAAADRQAQLRTEQAAQAQLVKQQAAPTTWLGLTPWVWGGIGLTTALVATGAVTGIMALSKSSEYKDSETPPSERQDLKDSGETMAMISTVTFGAAAASAIGTAALWWFTRPTEQQSVAMTVSFDHPGLAVSGSF